MKMWNYIITNVKMLWERLWNKACSLFINLLKFFKRSKDKIYKAYCIRTQNARKQSSSLRTIDLNVLLIHTTIFILLLAYFILINDSVLLHADDNIVEWWDKHRDPKISESYKDVNSLGQSLQAKYFFDDQETIRKSIVENMEDRLIKIGRISNNWMLDELHRLNIGSNEVQYTENDFKPLNKEEKKYISFLSVKEYPDIYSSRGRIGIIDDEVQYTGKLYGHKVKQNNLSVGDIVRINKMYKGVPEWDSLNNSRNNFSDIINLVRLCK
nr:hypothetical protein [Ophiocordyceps sp.]